MNDSPCDVIPLLPPAVAQRFSQRIRHVSKKHPNFCQPDILLIIRAAQSNYVALTATQIQILRHIALGKHRQTIDQIGRDMKLHKRIVHPIRRLLAKGLIGRTEKGLFSIKPEGAQYIHATLPAH